MNLEIGVIPKDPTKDGESWCLIRISDGAIMVQSDKKGCEFHLSRSNPKKYKIEKAHHYRRLRTF